MVYAVCDRIFWIYFIVTLFFIIIGFSLILSSGDPNIAIVSTLWLLSNIALMVIVYESSAIWGPTLDNNVSPVCLVDSKSWCLEPSNKILVFINIMFILLLVLGTVWTGELHNMEPGSTGSISGVLILLGGLLLCGLSTNRSKNINESPIHGDGMMTVPFWMSIFYLVLWFVLTLYIALTIQ